MLDVLTVESFAPLVGGEFRVAADSGAGIVATLVEARALGPVHPVGPGPRRQPFTLVFRAPRGTTLPQRIYRVDHDRLGPCNIFLVPVGPGHGGMLYEAVFT